MKKGFTLVELLIVMVVVTLLVTIATPKYKVAMEKGRGLEGIHNAQSISDALNAFYIQDGNVYNSGRQQWAIDDAGTTGGKYFACSIVSDTQVNVVCTRNNNSYEIIFSNQSGETKGKYCSGNERYCRALGATTPDGDKWKF